MLHEDPMGIEQDPNNNTQGIHIKMSGVNGDNIDAPIFSIKII